MTIIVFLVDTSASMNTRTYLGTTLLDITKGAVEQFMKIRYRDPASRMDRYMLLTFEDPPANVKAGWKEGHATFTNELKNLQATGLTTAGPALKQTFDLLNVNRMTSGIDTYGQGRFPFYLEPAVIVCVTDGRKLTTTGSVQNELNLPMNNMVPGSELTKEPFRWDQRLFALMLRIPAVPPVDNMTPFIPPADDSPIDAMCEVTGGRSYNITSQRTLMQCLDSLVQKVQTGVVINFEKIGPDPAPVESKTETEKDSSSKENLDANIQPGQQVNDKNRSTMPSLTINNTAWHSCRKQIYVPRSAQKGYSVGHWPIPEAFWPDLNSPALPPRSAQPTVKFSCTPCEPLAVENIAFDKYELEPSPLTQYLLERGQPNVAWQVFVSNSAKYSDIGHPFGYLKAGSNLKSVSLIVMPYNYPVLLPLLDELFKVHKLKPTQKWRQQFDNYLKTMPVYYAQPLRRALGPRLANLVPDQLENCLSYSVVSYLKKLKNQAKMEYERLVMSVGQKAPTTESIKVTPRSQTSLLQHKDFNQLLHHYGGDISHLKQELNEFSSFSIATLDKNVKPNTYRNPYDIPRKDLLDQVSRMRANFLHASLAGSQLEGEDELHSIPVQQMGNYQEYLKKQPSPLRELETAPVRQHMFGNPFKVNKNLMIDEADEAMPGQQSARRRSASTASLDSPPPSPSPKKRKPGPLPKDTPYRRPTTPPPGTPPSSPPESSLITGDNNPGKHFKSAVSLQPDNAPSPIAVDPSETAVLVNHVNNHIELTNHTGLERPADPVRESIEITPLDNGITLPTEEQSTNNNMKLSASALEYNNQIRELIIKQVKRPGKNYDNLFSHMDSMQGNLEIKSVFVKGIIHEALRFKRKTLAHLLEQYEQSLFKLEVKML